MDTSIKNKSDSLNIYKEVLSVTDDILASAKKEKWDDVLSLMRNYESKYKQLKKVKIDLSQASEIRETLTLILKNDVEIKALINPRLDSLRQYMDVNKNQKNAIHAYHQTEVS